MLSLTVAIAALSCSVAAAASTAAVARMPMLSITHAASSSAPRVLPGGFSMMGVSRKQERTAIGKGKGKGKGRSKGGSKGKVANVVTTEDADANVDIDSGNGFGNATPNPEEQLLNNPLAELQASAAAAPMAPARIAGCEPVFALATEKLLESQRVGSLAAPPTYDAVLDALLAVTPDDDGAMEAFVQANRDLLDYRFLYQLTADKLLADNMGDTTRSAALQAARVRAVAAAQRFDTGLFKEVGAAEGRLGGVLAQYMQGKTPEASAVVEACGTTPMAAFAFWFVTLAAMAAWESKLNVPSVAEQATAKLAELGAVRDAIESEAAGTAVAESGILDLAPLFALPNPAAAAPTSGAYSNARKALDSADADAISRLALVRRIGCTYCQASRHGFKAYNPMVQHAAALYDVLLYGAPRTLSGVDIRGTPRQPTSQMVLMANDADKVLEQANVDIPLFW